MQPHIENARPKPAHRRGIALVAVALIVGIAPACVRPPWLSRPGQNHGQDVELTSGDTHSCALTIIGTVKCWGANTYGALGDGTTTDRSEPVLVAQLGPGVRAVSAGWHHTCALTHVGGVKCWGYNLRGQLGDGTTTMRTTPVDVVGLTRGVRAIASGVFHTCALTSGGAVKCWGLNHAGQLGNGTTENSSVPVDVVGLGQGVTAVTSGIWHSCAITPGGAAKCWGQNNFGQLGDGTTENRSTPVGVTGLDGGVSVIRAGTGGDGGADGSHTCAVVGGSGNERGGVRPRPDGGGAKCWGINSVGQLGDGTTTTRLVPVDVVGATTGIASVAAAGGYSCALRTDGGVACWGFNPFGQLGDGTTENRAVPTPVVGLASGVTVLASGGYHSCVLVRSGGVKCWGGNGNGQVGDGEHERNHLVPVDVSASLYRRECPTIVAAPHSGFALTNGYGIGSVATFSADPGYSLVGAATMRCSTDAMWIGAPPATATAGRVTLAPGGGLVDGQSIAVTMSGFAPSTTLGWCQAAVAGGVTPGPGLCGGPVRTGTSDASGGLTDPTYPVARTIFVPALGRTVDCADPAERCVIGAADVRDVPASVAIADLTFAP